MLSFQGSLTEHWEMFVNVGLGLILDLHPCKTALQRLGWLELGQRKLLPDFWPIGSRGTGREPMSTGVERREGGKVHRCSCSHESRGGGAWKGTMSVANPPAKIDARSMVTTEGASFCQWFGA